MRGRVVLLLVAVMFTGCGDKDAGDDFVRPEKDDHGRFMVRLNPDRAFDPDFISVPTGAGVVFIAELDGCNVQSVEPSGPDSSKGSGTTFNNGLIPRGQEYAWLAPAAPAEFSVSCRTYADQGMTAVLRIA